ncbi:hypothetical protein CPB83DRAFT_886844 [Crepidotus variabilis]|uniref:DUF4048 domain-containing protein n=1 Tax=Crepidotus variabilis TaxID=179855 RepID=A0A9P6JK47_9AGAR|nr:hypothetical protein CPB83DRAFT_886844 [Crepidotus variabilis]
MDAASFEPGQEGPSSSDTNGIVSNAVPEAGLQLEPRVESPAARSKKDRPTPLSPSTATHSPPPLNLNQMKRQSTPNPRRQSSISYISSSPTASPGLASPASFARSPILSPRSPNIRQSTDATNGYFGSGNPRSPLSATTPSNEGSTVVTLARSHSVSGPSRGSGIPTSRGLKSPGFERSSTGSLATGGLSVDQKMADAVRQLKERPPMTLVEKHADLLQFIAQKESKCLDLRSQLATHEAELHQLKKKWERIVNRGFDKSSSPTSPSANLNLNLSPSITYNTPLSPGAHAPVLEGIKEGVQGVGRFIAAMTGSGPLEPDSTKRNEENITTTLPSKASSTSTSGILPLKLAASADKEAEKDTLIDGELEKEMAAMRASKLERRTSRYGHGQKESQSSSSTNASTSTSISMVSGFSTVTTTSTATTASVSSRRDRSSIISLKDGEFLGSPLKRDSRTISTPISVPSIEAESDFGDFHEGISASSISSTSMSGSEQVLIVRDTGAMPMMSPNPEFERKRRKKEKKDAKEKENSGFSSPASAGKDEENIFDAWDDATAWPEDTLESTVRTPTSSRRPNDEVNPLHSQAKSTRPGPSGKSIPGQASRKGQQQPQPLPPMSSIPGMATMGMAAPAAHQVSSWVGSVGKKWGDIKGSSAFAKNQKRASLLLNDMQNSLVSALISPTPLAPSSPHATSRSPHLSPHDHSQIKRSPSASSSTSASLLDDSDEDLGAAGDDTVKMSTPVLVPSPVSPVSPTTVGQDKDKTADDEEWNW